ncbi:hypothetical protein [Aeoliella sp.]|uniref:hypothetical protein n=1 Tax=Aeoliella sp. TaxID=2795800 RepID=UPI003CCBEC18
MPTVVLQHIETIWTKTSRGGEGARRRNAVPEAVELPTLEAEHPFVLHHAVFGERNEFARVDRCLSADAFDDLGLKLLSIEIDEEQLSLRYHRDGFNFITSSPYPCKYPITLTHDAWGRLAYNARHSDCDTGDWWYEKHVFNIGWLEDWTPRVFLDGAPEKEYREMAQLR